MKPANAKELAAIISHAKEPFELLGSGTKRGLGRPVKAATLDLSAFSTVIAYEPEELIIECGAGLQLGTLQKLLKQHHQMLAFEPPDYATVLATQHAGTIGGTLMCNLSGPRRLKAGAARDHILGLSGVNGQGEIIKAGARVVKNVTGYDVPRLLAGSYGTLLALTSVIFKVLPQPETEMTVQVPCSTPTAALGLMSAALQSTAEVSSAAFVPEKGVYLRLEGIEASVTDRCDTLLKFLPAKCESLKSAASQRLWADLRDVAPLWKFKAHNLWRICLPPSDAAQFLANLHFEFNYFLDWAGGLIWLVCKPQDEAEQIRNACPQGHAMLFRATAQQRSEVAVFQPQTKELADLSARIKRAFDPQGLFNPQRMYKGL